MISSRTKGMLAAVAAAALIVATGVYVFVFVESNNGEIVYTEVESLDGVTVTSDGDLDGAVIYYVNSAGETAIRFVEGGQTYKVTGALQGSIFVDVGTSSDITLEMSDLSLSSNVSVPFMVESADTVNIVVSNGTLTMMDFSEATENQYVVGSSCVLNISGDGSVVIQSTHNNGLLMDTGVFSVAEMTITSEYDCMRATGSIDIASGTNTYTSTSGAGIIAGGDVTVSSDLEIRSAENGIDSEGYVDLESDSTVMIKTADMSPRSDVKYIYIGYATTDYRFSIKTTNYLGEVIWINPSGEPTRVQDAMAKCYVYAFPVPMDVHSFEIYAYKYGQAQGQDTDYHSKSAVIETGFDRNSFLITQIAWGQEIMYKMANFGGPQKPDFDQMPTAGISGEKGVNVESIYLRIDSNGDSIVSMGGKVTLNGQNVEAFSRFSNISCKELEILSGDIVLISTGNKSSAIRTDSGYTYNGGRVFAMCVSNDDSKAQMSNCENYSDVATAVEFDSLTAGTYVVVSVDSVTQVAVTVPDNGTGAPPIPEGGMGEAPEGEIPEGDAPFAEPGQGDDPYSGMLVTYLGSNSADIVNTTEGDYDFDENGIWWSTQE